MIEVPPIVSQLPDEQCFFPPHIRCAGSCLVVAAGTGVAVLLLLVIVVRLARIFEFDLK